MKLTTGQYKNAIYYREQGYHLVGITESKPKDIFLDGHLPIVFPSEALLFNKKLEPAIKMSMYQQALVKVSPNKIKAALKQLDFDKICLLSWERANSKFSPRKALAAYLVKNLGLKVHELSTKQTSDIKIDPKKLDDL